MNVTIKVIPHKEHRYETVGDWWWTDNNDGRDGGDLEIRVSDMQNWRYEMLVAFHELCEVLICRFTGVRQVDVDVFDKQFEKEREQGIHPTTAEPGDDYRAPYKWAHFTATTCERILAVALGVGWEDYDNTVMSL